MDEFFDAVPMPVVVAVPGTDPALRFVNRAFVRHFGFTATDLPTLGAWFARGSAVQRAACEAWWRRVTASPAGTSTPTELELVDATGTPHAVLVAVNVGPDAAVLSLVDVTGRKATEERLRISETRYRLLADNARDVVWTMSVDGAITYVSPSVEQVRGYTAEEAMHQTIDQIHPPASQAISLGYFVALAEDLAAGRPAKGFRGELEYLCKDGSTFWSEVIALPVADTNGTVKEIIGVTRDLSERKAAEARVKAALDENLALVEDLRRALQEVKTLTGLLPICMYCKKIRNSDGCWDQLENYISTHTDAMFSHGLCAACEAEHFDD